MAAKNPRDNGPAHFDDTVLLLFNENLYVSVEADGSIKSRFDGGHTSRHVLKDYNRSNVGDVGLKWILVGTEENNSKAVVFSF